MQTLNLPMCTMEMFSKENIQFWMEDLSGILERYPRFEFPHKSDFFTLLVIEHAHGEITIDNHKIRLDESKAIIIKPRCISSLDISRSSNGKLICFTEDFFSLRYNNNVLHQFSFQQRDSNVFIRLGEEQQIRWNAIIQFMENEHIHQRNQCNTVLRSYLNILLFELDRMLNVNSIYSTKNIKRDKIFEFEQLIEKHFQASKLPSDYAEMMHLSANYLNKLCKEETGQTAGTLIRKRIIIEAQRLLHYTNLSINEIADKLGFENPSYFITFFKKETHFPPDQFRRLHS